MGSNPNELDEFERMIMESWRTAFPYLDENTLILVYPHISDAVLRMNMSPLLMSSSDRDQDCYLKPLASPEERTIMVLADMVAALIFPETFIPGIIDKAKVEIEEAYRAIMEEGGGWSDVHKSSRDKRKKALLEWYQRNQARLSYLKESYLEDGRLYEGRGGQEKRDFRDILLIKVIKHVVKQELTFAKVRNLTENLKKSKQPLR
jgi:hypothetical protein